MNRCWFAGWAGNGSRAHEIFGENVRANGFAAGVPDLAKDMRTACELPLIARNRDFVLGW
jgi:hypothetical protein